MFFVYILKNNTDKLYIGQTVDLKQRLDRHNVGRGARYTSDVEKFKLIYSEKFFTLDKAVKREKQLKNWSRAKKEALIKGDRELLKRL